jgi:hypothetical protein
MSNEAGRGGVKVKYGLGAKLVVRQNSGRL